MPLQSADANRVNLSYVQEASGIANYGVIPTPASSVTLNDLRYTKESLGMETDSKRSLEIRADRQVPDLIRTDVSAAGDIEFELSYGAYDTYLQWALQSAGWSTVVTQTPITITAAAAGNTLTRSAGSFTPGAPNDIVVGQWVKVSGLTTNGAAFFAKVTAVSSTVLTVSGITLVNEGPTGGCTVVMGAQITNGTSLFSQDIEKQYTDLTNVFSVLTGMCIDGMEVNLAAGEIATGKFSFMGKREISNTTSISSIGHTAAAANSIMNGIDNVVAVLENSSSFAGTSFGIKLGNNLRTRKVLGVLGADSVGSGTVDVTGSLQAYFSTAALIDKYLSFTQSSLAFILGTAAAKAYVIDLPAVKYSKGTRVAGGINTDVMAELEYTAIRHSTGASPEGITARIARFP
jgi:hypothetical protein